MYIYVHKTYSCFKSKSTLASDHNFSKSSRDLLYLDIFDLTAVISTSVFDNEKREQIKIPVYLLLNNSFEQLSRSFHVDQPLKSKQSYQFFLLTYMKISFYLYI